MNTTLLEYVLLENYSIIMNNPIFLMFINTFWKAEKSGNILARKKNVALRSLVHPAVSRDHMYHCVTSDPVHFVCVFEGGARDQVTWYVLANETAWLAS